MVEEKVGDDTKNNTSSIEDIDYKFCIWTEERGNLFSTSRLENLDEDIHRKVGISKKVLDGKDFLLIIQMRLSMYDAN